MGLGSTISTHLSVPVFNVLKYLVTTVAIDIIVRSALNGLEHFRRRLHLFHGHSVPVTPARFDRYNLLHTLSPRHLTSAVVLFVVTLCAYAVEIGLEFATDSEVVRLAVAANITRLKDGSQDVCSFDTLILPNNADHLSNLAQKCVVEHDGKYRLFRPTWIVERDKSLGVLCEQTNENLLDESDAVYSSLRGHTEQDAQELHHLDQLLRAHSYRSGGDAGFWYIAIQINSSDVFRTIVFTDDERDIRFTLSYFRRRIADTVECFGWAEGRHGDGMVFVAMIACVNGYTSNSSISFTYGTAYLPIDGAQLSTNQTWSAIVASENRQLLHHYLRGVFRQGTRANAEAYAAFLARSIALGITNLNKYAIAYRNCENLTLPAQGQACEGDSCVELFPSASSEVRVTATVKSWGVVLIVSWVFIVKIAQLVLHAIANRKRMPDRLFGEAQVLQLCVAEKCGKETTQSAGDYSCSAKSAFLSVKIGETKDRVIATNKPQDVIRDRRKPFYR
eukprot:TRINITY_DN959_c0_g1_i1.p1 TRINITY_DN959_c0_g1~~TRINITY_DN959_c0_g1_i1.p1  ORF type:complete len:505 (+),score=60.69 TRINITY_DN959_c0_g1_i1:749-2263(+)